MKIRVHTALLVLASVLIVRAMGQEFTPPDLLAYQGRLLIPGGTPVPTQVDIETSIYDSVTSTTPVWGPQRFHAVTVAGGMFSVALGPEDDVDNNPSTSGRPLSGAFDGPERWIEVKADGVTLPRQRMLCVPYAMTANSAARAQTTVRVDPGGVGNSALANDSVTTEKVKDKAIHTDDLADRCVGTEKLADGSITKSKLAPLGSVGGGGYGSTIITGETPDSAGLIRRPKSSVTLFPNSRISLTASGTGRPILVTLYSPEGHTSIYQDLIVNPGSGVFELRTSWGGIYSNRSHYCTEACAGPPATAVQFFVLPPIGVTDIWVELHATGGVVGVADGIGLLAIEY